jgi:hypothetical protein
MNRGVHRTTSRLNQQYDFSNVAFSRSGPDLSDDVTSPVPGWPQLASIIAAKPDLESFPTFEDLSIKSLLYYQAELVFLRKELHKAEWKDFRQPEDDDDDNDFPSFCENLHLFILAREQANNNQGEMPRQWVLIERIRSTLQKYRRLVVSILKET